MSSDLRERRCQNELVFPSELFFLSLQTTAGNQVARGLERGLQRQNGAVEEASPTLVRWKTHQLRGNPYVTIALFTCQWGMRKLPQPITYMRKPWIITATGEAILQLTRFALTSTARYSLGLVRTGPGTDQPRVISNNFSHLDKNPIYVTRFVESLHPAGLNNQHRGNSFRILSAAPGGGDETGKGSTKALDNERSLVARI